MKLQQISVFLENRPGALIEPCRVLAEAGINLVTLSVADSEKFGILRLIVQDWSKAMDLLQSRGFVAKTTEVVAIEVPDRPGGLVGVLEALQRAGVNVEYMYAFPIARGGRAVLVFRLDDPDAAIAALGQAPVTVLDPLDLFPQANSGGA